MVEDREIAARRRELALFDTLGPRARRVISEAPAEVDIAKLLSAFEVGRCQALRHLDPDRWPPIPSIATPAGDEALAAFLLEAIRRRFGPPETYVIERHRRHG